MHVNQACLNGTSHQVPMQQSILEGELDQLRSESMRVNNLSDTILNILRPSPPCEASCSQTSPVTVADALRHIRTIAEGSRENLESAMQILEEQLGNLKLEY